MGKNITQKEVIQFMYKQVREDSESNTETCLQFMAWLHKEKGEAHYLKDMEGLTTVEKEYLKQLLEEKI